MSAPSEPRDDLREKIIGLGEKSIRKSYYPELQRRIRELEDAKALLERKNAELERYLYVASHDLRSPLVNIQGFSARFGAQSGEIADLLGEMSLEGPDEYRRETALEILRDKIPRSVGFIVTNVAKMDRLLAGLLDVSRTGRLAMSIGLVDMNALVAGVVSGKSFEIESAGARVDVSNLPPCYGDADLLARAFSNLIGNAVKYRSPHRPPVVTVSGRRVGGECRYSVRDNGIGIAERHLERVWDVFFRVTGGAEASGDGIGLSIVRRVAEKHRGSVSLESLEGEGSVFSLTLPGEPFEEGS